MRIAVIGAGFSGLAICWFLAHGQNNQVTLFEMQGVGGGASGVSCGLLHAYAGVHAKKTWMADEGLKSTRQLLDISSQALQQPVANYAGILRPIQNLTQQKDFYLAAQKYSDLEIWSEEKCQKYIPELSSEGLFVKSGITVDSQKYLEGLWLACRHAGVELKQDTFHQLSDFDSFDAIVIAAGAGIFKLPELAHLPLFAIKGQVIELSWPKQRPPLPFSLIANCYLVMQPGNQSCIVGATYERQYQDEFADISMASSYLKTKAVSLLPYLAEAPVLSCRAGLRIFSPDNLTPLIGLLPKFSKPTWLFTGLGSKGLLHHAWLANLCSKAILNNDASILPREVRWRLET